MSSNTATYIVTGANRGIGLEFVKQLSARGDTVFATARNPEAAKDLQALAAERNVFIIPLEVTDSESIKAAAKEIDAKAPQGVDVLINNAGINAIRYNDFETT
jgi:NAD(P)-dependent dehydrogenase (short-subunit alcohol dehydrogenase family)